MHASVVREIGMPVEVHLPRRFELLWDRQEVNVCLPLVSYTRDPVLVDGAGSEVLEEAEERLVDLHLGLRARLVELCVDIASDEVPALC